MAVEIKELVIKAVIAPADGEQASAGPAAGGSADQQELIQACVEQVLKILKKGKNPVAMALANLFKLEKLQVLVFEDAARQSCRDKFELMFNPESYSLSYKNVYSTRQGINTSGRAADYLFGKPAQFSLKIIIDGTGTTELGLLPRVDVQDEVDRFLKLAANMDGKLHEPRFLVVKWGKLAFSCRLEQTQITYTLFDNGGLPLRAELDTLFIHDQDDKTRLQAEGKNSPDLTHVRIVQAHQTLPLLCKEIYGSPNYYIQVAKANGLDNFRNLQPGQRLIFPPLEK